MGIHRILVLAAMFFLVALCPRFEMALVIMILGMAVYLFSWLLDIFKRKGEP